MLFPPLLFNDDIVGVCFGPKNDENSGFFAVGMFIEPSPLSNPVAITVISNSSFNDSSITAPKIIFASGSADF